MNPAEWITEIVQYSTESYEHFSTHLGDHLKALLNSFSAHSRTNECTHGTVMSQPTIGSYQGSTRTQSLAALCVCVCVCVCVCCVSNSLLQIPTSLWPAFQTASLHEINAAPAF